MSQRPSRLLARETTKLQCGRSPSFFATVIQTKTSSCWSFGYVIPLSRLIIVVELACAGRSLVFEWRIHRWGIACTRPSWHHRCRQGNTQLRPGKFLIISYATNFSRRNFFGGIKAYMYVLLGNRYMKEGDYERAIQLFDHARASSSSHTSPRLEIVSLVHQLSFTHTPV